MKIVQSLKVEQIRNLVAELMGYPMGRVLQFGRQQDVSELKSFITVQFNPSAEMWTHKKYNKQNELLNIESLKQTVATIGFHGENAVEMGNFFKLCLISEKANSLFDKIKCGLVASSDVQDLTIPFGAGYEERAQIQLTLSHTFIIKHEHNRIESVDIGMVLNQ